MNIKSGIVESIYPPDKTNVLWVHKGILKHFKNGKWESISQGETGTTELEEKVDSLDKEMGEVKNDLIKFGSTLGVVELLIGNSEAIKASNLKILQSIQSTDHTFFTDIDYGYGTGLWLPATGGKATIFTSAGHMVCYTIGTDGSVTKASESTIGSNSDGLTIFTVNKSALDTSNSDYIGKYTLSEEEKEVFKKGVDCIRLVEVIGDETVATQVYFRKYEKKGFYSADCWSCIHEGVYPNDSSPHYVALWKVTIYEGKLTFHKEGKMIHPEPFNIWEINTSSDTETICAAINSILELLWDSNIAALESPS